jgi:hypothetical protein
VFFEQELHVCNFFILKVNTGTGNLLSLSRCVLSLLVEWRRVPTAPGKVNPGLFYDIHFDPITLKELLLHKERMQ